MTPAQAEQMLALLVTIYERLGRIERLLGGPTPAASRATIIPIRGKVT